MDQLEYFLATLKDALRVSYPNATATRMMLSGPFYFAMETGISSIDFGRLFLLNLTINNVKNHLIPFRLPDILSHPFINSTHALLPPMKSLLL